MTTTKARFAPKRTLIATLNHMPPAVRSALLRRAALAPPLFKTRNFERLFGRIHQTEADGRQLIETNFGLSTGLSALDRAAAICSKS